MPPPPAAGSSHTAPYNADANGSVHPVQLGAPSTLEALCVCLLPLRQAHLTRPHMLADLKGDGKQRQSRHRCSTSQGADATRGNQGADATQVKAQMQTRVKAESQHEGIKAQMKHASRQSRNMRQSRRRCNTSQGTDAT